MGSSYRPHRRPPGPSRAGGGGECQGSLSSLPPEKGDWGGVGWGRAGPAHLLNVHERVAQQQAGVGARQVFAELPAKVTECLSQARASSLSRIPSPPPLSH